MCALFFIRFGKFSAIIFSNILLAPFLLSFPSRAPIMHTLVYLTVFKVLVMELILYSFCSSD